MTDRNMQLVLDDIVILVDTREQKNEHIIEWLRNKGIKYRITKIDHESRLD